MCRRKTKFGRGKLLCSLKSVMPWVGLARDQVRNKSQVGGKTMSEYTEDVLEYVSFCGDPADAAKSEKSPLGNNIWKCTRIQMLLAKLNLQGNTVCFTRG
jgi:hypothetical protein